MANNLGVSLDKLVETLAVIREQDQIMANKLNNVSDNVTNLRSVWDSPAAQNIQGIASKMSDRFNDLHKDVMAFAAFLDGVIRNYDVTESQADQVMQSVMQSFK